MQKFFSPTWQQCTRQAVLAFFATVLPETPLPTILQLQADRQAAQRSAADAAALRRENAHLQECLCAQQQQQQQHDHGAHSDTDVQHGVSHSAAEWGGEEGVELKDMRSHSGVAPELRDSSEWPPRGMATVPGADTRGELSHSVPPGVAAGGARDAPSVAAVALAQCPPMGAAPPDDGRASRQTARGEADGTPAQSREHVPNAGRAGPFGSAAGVAGRPLSMRDDRRLPTAETREEQHHYDGAAEPGALQTRHGTRAAGHAESGAVAVESCEAAPQAVDRVQPPAEGAPRHRFTSARARSTQPGDDKKEPIDSIERRAAQCRPDG